MPRFVAKGAKVVPEKSRMTDRVLRAPPVAPAIVGSSLSEPNDISSNLRTAKRTRAPSVFHVERGALPSYTIGGKGTTPRSPVHPWIVGLNVPRGTNAGSSQDCRRQRRTKRRIPSRLSSSTKPRALMSATAHRGKPDGGSLIKTTPPALTMGADTSSTVSGGPKLRAVTTSNCPTKSATSPSCTLTEPSKPSARIPYRSKSTRLVRRSTNVTETSGRRWAMTRPGRPPPEPRSTSDNAATLAAGTARTKRSAWATSSGSDVRPIAPRRWISERTRTRSSSGIRRFDHDAPLGVVALGPCDHTIHLRQHIVDDLAIG